MKFDTFFALYYILLANYGFGVLILIGFSSIQRIHHLTDSVIGRATLFSF